MSFRYVFFTLLFFSAGVNADWAFDTHDNELYDSTSKYSATVSTNEPEIALVLSCNTYTHSEIGETSDLSLKLILPDNHTIPTDKQLHVDLRVDKQPLKELKFNHVGGNVFALNLLNTYNFGFLKNRPIYNDDDGRLLLNEMLDGITTRVRISSGREVHMPVFNLLGMTKISLPVLQACSLKTREHTGRAKTREEFTAYTKKQAAMGAELRAKYLKE